MTLLKYTITLTVILCLWFLIPFPWKEVALFEQLIDGSKSSEQLTQESFFIWIRWFVKLSYVAAGIWGSVLLFRGKRLGIFVALAYSCAYLGYIFVHLWLSSDSLNLTLVDAWLWEWSGAIRLGSISVLSFIHAHVVIPFLQVIILFGVVQTAGRVYGKS